MPEFDAGCSDVTIDLLSRKSNLMHEGVREEDKVAALSCWFVVSLTRVFGNREERSRRKEPLTFVDQTRDRSTGSTLDILAVIPVPSPPPASILSFSPSTLKLSSPASNISAKYAAKLALIGPANPRDDFL